MTAPHRRAGASSGGERKAHPGNGQIEALIGLRVSNGFSELAINMLAS
jgi:hypothetical protein